MATVQPGTVNGIIPSNLFDSFAIDLTSTWYLVVTCSASDGVVTSAVLSASTTPPTPQSASASLPPATFVIPFGIIIAGTAYCLLTANWISATPSALYTVTHEDGSISTYYAWSW